MKSTSMALLLGSLALAGVKGTSCEELDHYLCYRAIGPITIDGKLDEASWERAPRSGAFVHLVSGKPIPPMLESRAALLWVGKASNKTCYFSRLEFYRMEWQLGMIYAISLYGENSIV